MSMMTLTSHGIREGSRADRPEEEKEEEKAKEKERQRRNKILQSSVHRKEKEEGKAAVTW